MEKLDTKEEFSLVKRAKSFSYAGRGIVVFIKTTPNAWIHLLILGVAVGLGMYFGITKTEWLILVLTAGLVLTAEALKFLRTIVQDKLFISVTGMDSAVGENYSGKNLPIVDRFVRLEPAEADIFQIQAPVCLYKKEEFIDLLKKAGWEVEDVWQSAFGNLKAVCQ